MENKGKTALPDGFAVTQEMRGWARFNCPGVDVDAVTAEFIDYCHARDWRMKDWIATWRNWMRKASKSSQGKSFHAAPVAPVPPPQPPQVQTWPQQDQYKAVLNGAITRILMSLGGVSTDQLRAVVRERNRLAAEMRQMWGDKPNPEEYADLRDGYVRALRAAATSSPPCSQNLSASAA